MLDASDVHCSLSLVQCNDPVSLIRKSSFTHNEEFDLLVRKHVDGLKGISYFLF